ncbi:MAG: DUF11 domain-containing protein [Ruminococcaceae bacterium]|nr:DUF11 domain-containing protein [Oscillospiraceae bacterium]
MTYNPKAEALFTAAQAYVDRGFWLQYDQLSMDRLIRITPRRRFRLPPEAATSQQRLYLDCATFVWAAFYNAFGYQLEATVTWNIRDLVRDCVFRHDFTGEETPEEIEAMSKQVKELLQPGDAVIVSRATNGHIMLYKNEHEYYHCTQPMGIPGSYNYKELRDNINPHGGMYIGDPRWWFEKSDEERYARRYLFNENVCKLAVVRPLNYVGDPTPDTLARMTTAKDLFFSVTASHSGGQTAAPGDTVEYTLSVENRRSDAAQVQIQFTPPAGCCPSGEFACTTEIPAGESCTCTFSVTAENIQSPAIDAPIIIANGLHVYAPPVLIGTNLTADEVEKVVSAMHTASGISSAEAITVAYASIGIPVPAAHNLLLRDLFYRHDAYTDHVWSRRRQNPAQDMALYSYFGGIGVITPEACYDPFIRTTQLRMDDLQPGDVLLCSDDHTGLKTYAAMYTGDGFCGSFAPDQSIDAISGDAAAAYLDTLPGRYAYIILRPSLIK